jgi:hypothetical protein
MPYRAGGVALAGRTVACKPLPFRGRIACDRSQADNMLSETPAHPPLHPSQRTGKMHTRTCPTTESRLNDPDELRLLGL